MDEFGTARLTDTIPAGRALSVAIPRHELSDALIDADATPQLVLPVMPGGAEPAELGMTWRRDEVERLLSATSGPDVVLTFDREELAHAIGDVEAHGARSRAAVFAVADSTVTDASVPTGSGGGAFLDLHQPSTPDLIGGAFVLATAGASFATRRVGTARTV